MVDPDTRDRMAKVKALMASPNEGERQAARVRYAAMVAKYGDPEGSVFADYIAASYDRVHDMEVMFADGLVAFADIVMRDAIGRPNPDERMRKFRAAHRQAVWLAENTEKAIRWLENFTSFRIESVNGTGWNVNGPDGTGLLAGMDLIELARSHGWDLK